MTTLINALHDMLKDFMTSIPALDVSDPKMRSWDASYHPLS